MNHATPILLPATFTQSSWTGILQCDIMGVIVMNVVNPVNP